MESLKIESHPSKLLGRWSRMVLRLGHRAVWHVRGMLLWLLQRPYLRYAPFPYPSVSTVSQWQLQAEQMVASGALSKRHLERGRQQGVFKVGPLSELCWFRNRMGIHLSFLEDPMLIGMMAARQMKGAASNLRREAVKEAKAAAKQLESEGRQAEAVRSLIGPKGGLPTLKGDLVKLASLLHIEVHEKMTVEQLKVRCREVIRTMKFNPKAAAAPDSTSGSSLQSFKEIGHREEPPTTPTRMTRPMTSQSSSPGTLGTPGVDLEEVRGLLAKQDQKFQSMLNQVLQHVMQMQTPGYQMQPQMTMGPLAMEGVQAASEVEKEHGWTPAEIAQANADYYGSMLEMRANAQYGGLDHMTSAEIQAMQDEL